MSLVETIDSRPSEDTYCPDHDACFQAFMQLLPRGVAWDNVDHKYTKETNIRKFMSASALSWLHFEDAMCAALDEWFCLTSTVDKDAWNTDYGIPDECDLYNAEVCTKVMVNGPPTVENLMALLSSNGYIAEGRWLTGDDPEFPGVYSTFRVIVDPVNSPAFTEQTVLNFPLGVGRRLGDSDLVALECMLERYIPAHCAIDLAVAGSFSPITSLGAKLKTLWNAEDLAAGVVTTGWTDQVTGFVLAQTNPALQPTATTVDGVKTVQFAGGHFFRSGAIGSVLPVGATTGWIWFSVRQDNAGTTSRHIMDYGGSSGNQHRRVYKNGTGSIATLRVGGSLPADDLIGTQAFAGWQVGGGRFAETLISGRRGGLPMTPASVVQTTPLNTGSASATVGASNLSTPTLFWSGHMRAIAVTLDLTPHEYMQLEGWLAWDAGRQDALDSNHPYRNMRP